MSATTIQQVRGAAVRYSEALRELGMLADDERLILNEGSRTYGRAWRINLVRPGSGAEFSPPAGSDFLGWTKAEAWQTLADRAAVLADVIQHQREEVAR